MKKFNYKLLIEIILLALLIILFASLTFFPELMFVFRKPHGDNPFPMGILGYLRNFKLL
jgi:hypothetical protein